MSPVKRRAAVLKMPLTYQVERTLWYKSTIIEHIASQMRFVSSGLLYKRLVPDDKRDSNANNEWLIAALQMQKQEHSNPINLAGLAWREAK